LPYSRGGGVFAQRERKRFRVNRLYGYRPSASRNPSLGNVVDAHPFDFEWCAGPSRVRIGVHSDQTVERGGLPLTSVPQRDAECGRQTLGSGGSRLHDPVPSLGRQAAVLSGGFQVQQALRLQHSLGRGGGFCDHVDVERSAAIHTGGARHRHRSGTCIADHEWLRFRWSARSGGAFREPHFRGSGQAFDLR